MDAVLHEAMVVGRSVLLTGVAGCGKETSLREAAAKHNMTVAEVEPVDVYSLVYGNGEKAIRPCWGVVGEGVVGCLLIKHVEVLLEDDDLWPEFSRMVGGPPRGWVLVCTSREYLRIPEVILSKFTHVVEVPTPSLGERIEIIKKIGAEKQKMSEIDVEWAAGRLGGVPAGEIFSIFRKPFSRDEFNETCKGRVAVRGRVGETTIPKVEWKDLCGHEKVKSEIRNTLGLFKEGIDGCKGILLYGLPGNGKTMLAKAVATEVGGSFLYGSIPGLVKGYVGESERMVRELFKEASRNAPCCLFLDEVQAIFGDRESSSDHDARLISTLLTCIDTAPPSVVILAATNTPSQLDSSILSPSRLSLHIHVTPPTPSDREAFFSSNNLQNPSHLASLTPHYSYSDLASLLALSHHCQSIDEAISISHASADQEMLDEVLSWRPS